MTFSRCVWMQGLQNAVHSRLFLVTATHVCGTIFRDHSNFWCFHLLHCPKLCKICSLLEKHTFPEESQLEKPKKYFATMCIRALVIRCNFQQGWLKIISPLLPPTAIWEYSPKMVVKAYLIITSVNWQVHFPDAKNTGGDRHGLKLYFCSSDGSHKPSNVEARGRRSPRTSQKVRRTRTKTTAPVKSQPRSSCTLHASQTSKSGRIGRVASSLQVWYDSLVITGEEPREAMTE